MLIQKTDPKGIDLVLQSFQTDLHARLLAKWGIESDQYMCYPRADRNKTADGYIAEWFDGNDHKECYWDDALSIVSFFGRSVRSTYDVQTESDVHLVFFLDLQKIKPLITHRADEEVRVDILNVLEDQSYGFLIDSIESGIENVLREYPGSRRDKRLDIVDMQPRYSLRINFKLRFDHNVSNTITLN